MKVVLEHLDTILLETLIRGFPPRFLSFYREYTLESTNYITLVPLLVRVLPYPHNLL
jgi:hypothetical protein